jgi:MoxR-like ATPase
MSAHPELAFPFWVTHKNNRLPNGKYAMPKAEKGSPQVKVPRAPKEPKVQAPAAAEVVALPVKKFKVESNSEGFDNNLIPKKNPLYVPFGHHRDVDTIVKSGIFYPMFITGMSGNGKTHMSEQVCSSQKRMCIRVNFTIETDEDDLIGGFRLIDGETKFFKGPVIRAMELGAVLILDEIDLASPAKVMCLQSILEGSGYFIKKTGEFITPQPGFTVVATGNTKGKGSDDGRFIGTQVLNEALLERFPITFEQEYPAPAIEKRIIGKVFQHLGKNGDEDREFVNLLIDWADIIRQTFAQGGVDDLISTRRLIHIAKAYAIFNDRMKAIKMCINRFDEDTKSAFVELYSKLDASTGEVAVTAVDSKDEIPF